MISRFFKDLISCWIIVMISVCIGFLINQFRDKPIPLVYQSKAERLDVAVSRISTVQPSKNTEQLPSVLSLEQFKDFCQQKRGLVFDARPEIFHRLGHVPGALALPRDDFETYYKIHQAVLEKDKAQPICVYCTGSSCEDSELVEQALDKLGYSQVVVFRGGWGEWTAAGLPQEVNK